MPSVDMITAFGHSINYLHPEKATIDTEDIRVHTQNMCRYNGAIKWELIRHLVLTPRVLYQPPFQHSPDIKYNWTLQKAFCAAHDFHEYIVGDMISGLKKYIPDYNKIETAWEQRVHEAIALPLEYRNNRVVREADLKALVVEMTFLNHPAKKRVARRYQQPTSEDMKHIEHISSMSLEDCWREVWNTVLQGQAELQPHEDLLEITYTKEQHV